MTSYRVYEKNGTAEKPVYTLLATLPATVQQFTLVKPDPATAHTYVVTATNKAGEGDYGNEVTLPARPGPTGGVKGGSRS